ncbi:MAG: TIGR02757 family protein [Planctomycetota bacterium]
MSRWPEPPPRAWARARRDRERAWLEAMRRRHHHRRFLAPDPLQLVTPHRRLADREVAGLVAASLAYGSVVAMLPAIERVLAVLGPRPADGLETMSDRDLAEAFADFRYRVTDGRALAALLRGVRRLRREHGSLEAAFGLDDPGHRSIVPALSGFVARLRAAAGAPLPHLLPDPRDGSACKRPALWLRWMVRRDEIDPGGWRSVDPGRLLMPLDTHVFQTARTRRWTRRRTMGLATAMEITDRLRALEPGDPLRWDFAITRPGIRGDAPDEGTVDTISETVTEPPA